MTMHIVNEVSSPRNRRRSASANVPDFGMNESYEDGFVNDSVCEYSENSIHFEMDDVVGFNYRNENNSKKFPKSLGFDLFRNFPILDENYSPNATTVKIRTL
ncbi:hypothetical protein Plhal304r1_c068g0156061 [Plasmopara halstedii]